MKLGMSALVVSVAMFASAAAAQAGVVFSDDFSTNPLTNGKWGDFYRQNGDPGNELVWNSTLGAFDLTSTGPGAGFAVANHSLQSRNWVMEYDYRVGGGGSGDGYGFSFYSANDTVGGNRTLQGYWVFFDTFQNSWDPYSHYIGLSKRLTATVTPPIHTSLAAVADARTEDDRWHHVKVAFDEGRLRLFVDDMSTALLDHTIAGMDYTRDGISFFALGNNNYHRIDNVALSVAVPLPASAWTGLGLLGGIGVAAFRRRRRARLVAWSG